MKKRQPKYCLHKPTGQAYVRINRKLHYLGEYNSEASHKRYDALIAKWLGETFNAETESLTISRLAILYVEHARQYYRKGDVETSEVHSIQTALRPLVAKCGREKVLQFGPRRLMTVRDDMIQRGWTRTGINAAIRRIVRMLRWAVQQELTEPHVYDACKTVDGLRWGRTLAKEAKPVKPVPMADVEAVQPFLSEELWTMIQLQLLTAMRPGEACIMRLADINTSGEVWEYTPKTHKTQHHGRERVIPLGAKAQALIQPYLSADRERYFFSPQNAEAERNSARRENRQSPMTPSQAAREAKSDPVRTAGEFYQRQSYTKAIARACKLAKVDLWSPNRLRHNAATAIRKEFGLDAARTVLGHSEAETTQIYAEVDRNTARKVMQAIG
jgi:integrase